MLQDHSHPSAANFARLAPPKGYHAANACGLRQARSRQRPSSTRAHDTVGPGTKASRTAPATQCAPRQPGTRTGKARWFRDGAVESATSQRGPARPPSLQPPAATPPPALPRPAPGHPPRNGSSAQGACERGGSGSGSGEGRGTAHRAKPRLPPPPHSPRPRR